MKHPCRGLTVHFFILSFFTPSCLFAWNTKYLVEFRGGQHSFRWVASYVDYKLSIVLMIYFCLCRGHEVQDLLAAIMGCEIEDSKVIFEPVIPDNMSNESICAYMNFPNENVAKEVASRSGLIRSIIDVWGEGRTHEIASLMSQGDGIYKTKIEPIFRYGGFKNTWRVIFRRYGRRGRSGMTPESKRLFLQDFSPVLKRLGGEVDLINPYHDLIYLEDWHTFQKETSDLPTDRLQMQVVSTIRDNISQATHSNKDVKEHVYAPRKSIFGRIVATGLNVVNDFDVRVRPFIGTTTMDALSSHMAAVAARIQPNDIVLDPFCGTGSLLLACAKLGALVAGSDIDPDNIKVQESNSTYSDRSKNARFKRNTKTAGFEDQFDKCAVDNFHYYGLHDRLLGLWEMDAGTWKFGSLRLNIEV